MQNDSDKVSLVLCRLFEKKRERERDLERKETMFLSFKRENSFTHTYLQSKLNAIAINTYK